MDRIVDNLTLFNTLRILKLSIRPKKASPSGGVCKICGQHMVVMSIYNNLLSFEM